MRFLTTIFTLTLSLFVAQLAARNKLSHVIKFDVVGTNIIIPIKVNNSSPLNFIFDTGVQHTIITELQENDSITLNYMREVQLQGLGDGEPIMTLLSRQNQLSVQSLNIDSITIYALKENLFQLSKHLGSKVNGMIGFDLVKDYVIKIDYLKKRMYLYEPDGYTPPKSYRSVPMVIKSQKPYIECLVKIKSEKRKVNLLVDTGAELALWLVSSNFSTYSVPEKSIYTYIGQGLNGEIFGAVNRINAVEIAGHELHNPIAAFPDSVAIHMIIANNERDGTVGSEILRRFHVILNYNDTSMYIKRNSKFSERFSYNTTGMEVVQTFPNLPLYEVAELWDESPAALAGLKIGDRLESINYNPTNTLKLIEVKEMLRKSSGQIRLIITRQENGEIIRKKIKFKIYKL